MGGNGTTKQIKITAIRPYLFMVCSIHTNRNSMSELLSTIIIAKCKILIYAHKILRTLIMQHVVISRLRFIVLCMINKL